MARLASPQDPIQIGNITTLARPLRQSRRPTGSRRARSAVR